MNNENIKVEMLRHPEQADWERCKSFALNTVGKKYAGGTITDEWKDKILRAEHSPIRTLMFTFRLTIPYYVSVHLVRHKMGVEHFVQSQRNDRQSSYDRELAPQNSMVSHMMDINAHELMFMANRRLCGQADPTTRYVVSLMCKEVLKTNPEFKPFLVPNCVRNHGCREFTSCGFYGKVKP